MIIDKRVAKTRSSIKNALMVLSLEKEIKRISVSALTQKAEINRSTFYLHYSDVADVLKDIEREISLKISAHIKNFDFKNIYESTCLMLKGLTFALDENKIIKQYILQSTSSQYVIGRLKAILAENIMDAVILHNSKHIKDDLIYPLTYISSGIIDTYIYWAHSDDNNVSLDSLIKTVCALTEKTMDYLKE